MNIRRKWRKYITSFLLCSLTLCFIISIRLELLMLNYHKENSCQDQTEIINEIPANQTYTLIRKGSLRTVYQTVEKK